MNIVKYRPVGQPNGKVVRVRVSQKKRAIYGSYNADGQYRPPQSASVGSANRTMMRQGFVRASKHA